ncbi:MAG TPA: AGE family epimerase/isomerase, partial [Gemmataceae bacterium]|nr:AGE family epimerase/isomerase [Gemmataceae bacterium]
DAALPTKDAAALIRTVYGADGPPNFEDKAHILLLPEPLAERAKALHQTEEALEARLAPLRQKLLAARAKRPRPTRDTKVLTGWNGLMIAGYARAGQALGEPAYTRAAARAADFVLSHMRTRDGRLLRSYGAAPGEKPEARLSGYLDDYAYLVHGLLNLHDATGEARWLDEAKALTDVMVKYHADPDGGGFFYTANDHEKLFARAKGGSDTALPSGNSVAARDLVRLWRKTGDDRYRALAEKTLRAFAGPLKANPTGLTTMAEALALYLDKK